ncbi:MAG: hypothetical protein ACFFB3_10485 [Candidatus Hodarchaeota archaeon]
MADVLKDEIQQNLDFEIQNQNDDGLWSPTWIWGNHWKDEWKIAEREWKGILTLAMLRSIRDFDRIKGVPCLKGDFLFKYHID